MSKGKWDRRGMRSKFVVASVTPREKQDCYVCAHAMNLTVSACLRQLIKDQLYRLSTKSYVPSPEQTLDLSEVSND